MGLRAETLKAWGDTAPVVREEAWPPFVRPEPGLRIELVVRWAADEELKERMGRVVPWVIRLIFWWKGVTLTPHALEFIGPASSEEAARAASLDDSYCSFPMTVDSFLPREPVNLSGVRYWKRRLHKLFWLQEPDEVDPFKLLRTSELERLRSKAETLDRLKGRIRAAL
jgi:hypothetical protein